MKYVAKPIYLTEAFEQNPDLKPEFVLKEHLGAHRLLLAQGEEFVIFDPTPHELAYGLKYGRNAANMINLCEKSTITNKWPPAFLYTDKQPVKYGQTDLEALQDAYHLLDNL